MKADAALASGTVAQGGGPPAEVIRAGQTPLLGEETGVGILGGGTARVMTRGR